MKAPLPGIKPEDIEVSVTGQLLTLRGESREEREEKAQNFYRRERRTGAFVRQINLPTEVESEKAGAVFENGVLHLSLPKAEAVKPKTIKVQAKADDRERRLSAAVQQRYHPAADRGPEQFGASWRALIRRWRQIDA